jgi:RNA polymerase sigma-70 factor (ECF subfamily)
MKTEPPVIDTMRRNNSHTRNARLVEQAQAGSKQAFGQLCEAYFPRIFYLALRQLNSEDQAQDATQEVFLRMLLKLDTLKNPQAFQNWLYRIAHTVITDTQNNTNRSRATEYELDDEMVVPTEEESGEEEFLSEKILEAGVERRFIRVLLDTLTDAQREVILLHYFADLKPRDIAEVLNVPAATVSKRLHDARRSLQRLSAQATESQEQPTAPTQTATQADSHSVLSQLFARDLGHYDISQTEGLMFARIAALLPAALTIDKDAPAAVAERAQYFFDKAPAKKKPPVKPVAAIATTVVIVLALTTTIVALYRHNTAPTPKRAPAATVQPAAKPSASATAQASPEPEPKTEEKTATTQSRPTQAQAATTDKATASQDPTISVAQPNLSYKLGTKLTQQQILQDAGVTAHQTSAPVISVTITDLTRLDPTAPGTSVLFVRATDAAGHSSDTATILITYQ